MRLSTPDYRTSSALELHFSDYRVYQALGPLRSSYPLSEWAAVLAYTVPQENPTTTNEEKSEIRNSFYKEAQKEILISCSHSAPLGAFREAKGA